MSRPIKPTPILKGKNAENFLKEFKKVNKLLKNKSYRIKVYNMLEKCKQLYDNFMK